MSKLFEEFEKISPAAWKQKIQVDLKGADYNESLIWQSEEGILVKPFYTEEDRTYQEIELPKNGFHICQSIFVDNETVANSLACNAIEKGASAIQFVANKTFDIKKLLNGIKSNSILVYFKLNFLSYQFVKNLINHTEKDATYFQIDVLGSFANKGNWFENEDKSTCRSLF